jgi:uncharacterized protein YndB with AHSA1/START domain
MTSQAAETVLRRSITVEAPIDRAFKVFTEGFDTWWPREHHIGSADLSEAIIEGHVDGRWYERDVDGSECEWGRVLVWDPPRHVALSWHLNGEFQYDPDPDRSSRVDVRFVEESGARTRVELEHSSIDRHGDGWEKVFAGISAPGGWPDLIERYAAAAK